MKIAGVQMDVALGDIQHNLRRIELFAEQAKEKHSELIVFPECAITGYCFNSKKEALKSAEPIPGPILEQLTAIASRLNIHLVTGMIEQEGSSIYNVSVFVGPNGLIGKYRKAHLPFLGVDQFTTPGEAPFRVDHTDKFNIGMLICYDASFPEASRILSLEGADLIVLPTNWPYGAEPTADFVINARASENKVYFIAVDRVGKERGFQFIGKSKICDVHGNTIAEANHQNEEIIFADIDLEEARDKRIERVPGKHSIDRFADRRPDLYRRILDPPSGH